ncbi:MAG: SulP family inorganic anion transporter [Ilumatobacteraceae bacterium]|nr:SulP family inorganic anion transporter [Ilumatobacteraceae bacterium]
MARADDSMPRVATPGWRLLRGYQRSWLRGDLFAGLTVGALVITHCMAYAPLAGLPPSAAFHAVVVALPVFALLGTSRHLAIGPDPGTASIAGAGLLTVAAAGTDEYLAAAAALGLMVGLVLVVAGLLRFGFVADLLSRPALIGYMSGLGVTLLVSQLRPLLGVTVEADDTVGRVVDVLGALDEVGATTAAVGLGTLALILVLRRYLRTLPGSVIGLAIATVVVWLAGLDEHGVALVGPIDADLAPPALPGIPLDDWFALVPTALGLAVLGFADSFLAAKGVAARHDYRLDADRELSGLGAANLAAGAFQGMPVASTGSGTAAASAAGGRTSGLFVVAAAFVVLAIVALDPVIERIPSAGLAAVVAAAAINLVDVAGFRALWRESRLELLLAGVTFGSVVLFDVLVGIQVSIVLGLVIAIARMARPHDAILGSSETLDGWVDADTYETAAEPGLLVYRFDAPLMFVNATRFSERLLAALDENPGEERWVVLDFEGVGSVDTTATDALRELLDELDQRGVEVVGVARANRGSLDRLRRSDLLEPAGRLRVFPTINGAVRAFRAASSGPTAPAPPLD